LKKRPSSGTCTLTSISEANDPHVDIIAHMANDFIVIILGRTSQEWEGRFPDELRSGRAGFCNYESPQTLVENLEAFDSSSSSFDSMALLNSTRVIICLVDSCEVKRKYYSLLLFFFSCFLIYSYFIPSFSSKCWTTNQPNTGQVSVGRSKTGKELVFDCRRLDFTDCTELSFLPMGNLILHDRR